MFDSCCIGVGSCLQCSLSLAAAGEPSATIRSKTKRIRELCPAAMRCAARRRSAFIRRRVSVSHRPTDARVQLTLRTRKTRACALRSALRACQRERQLTAPWTVWGKAEVRLAKQSVCQSLQVAAAPVTRIVSRTILSTCSSRVALASRARAPGAPARRPAMRLRVRAAG